VIAWNLEELLSLARKQGTRIHRMIHPGIRYGVLSLNVVMLTGQRAHFENMAYGMFFSNNGSHSKSWSKGVFSHVSFRRTHDGCGSRPLEMALPEINVNDSNPTSRYRMNSGIEVL
jgi:hypothetical protein